MFTGSGTNFELMELLIDEQFQLVTSEEILEELYHVLHKPSVQKHFRPAEANITAFMELLRGKGCYHAGIFHKRLKIKTNYYQAIAARPLFLTRFNSLSEEPLGCFSPLSHLLTDPTETFR